MGTTVTDKGLAHLKNLKKLKALTLNNNKQITDAGLREIAGLTELRHLRLANTGVTPAVFDIVKDMKKLTFLELNFTTPDIIEKYDRLGILHAMIFVRRPASKFRPANPAEVTHADFHMNGKMITDANLKRFLQLTNITHLNIPNAHISEEGLKILAQMKTLQELSFSREGELMTKEQFLELKKALPKCNISILGQRF